MIVILGLIFPLVIKPSIPAHLRTEFGTVPQALDTRNKSPDITEVEFETIYPIFNGLSRKTKVGSHERQTK